MSTLECRLPLFDLPPVAIHTRGLGRIEATPAAGRRTRLPLAGVRLSARVAERIALVTTTQTFENDLSEPMEAVYVFPLAGGSAVSAFEMRVGERTIIGTVREREEARVQYRLAVEGGKRAGLLEQERDDVFTVSVGNVMPGESIEVRIETAERLPFFEDGSTELRLPLVVAPRYVPGVPLDGESCGDGVEADTDLVPDASRITPPRLARGFDPRVALGIEVAIETAGDTLADLACSQHATRTALTAGCVKVALAQDGERLDRDFVLRWRLGTDAIRASCLAWRDAEGVRYGMLTLVPPRREGFLGLARDVVLVLDRSGSMGGPKMASAARACSLLLATLGPRDHFALQAFDDRIEWMLPGGAGQQWTAADERGVERGERWLRTIESRGGTELDTATAEALRALAARAETEGRAPIVVILTDGQVGNESHVLEQIQRGLGDARVFTVGIDSAVNAGFLKRLAALGGGTSSFVVPGEKLEDALRAIGREIGAPLVTDLAIAGRGIDAGSLAPAHVPDLFAGRVASAFLKLDGAETLRVRGRLEGGGGFDTEVAVREVDLPAIAHLWARTRVADLEDRFRTEPARRNDLRAQIIKLAVAHRLLTRFTAFLAVDEAQVVNPSGRVRHVVQPVEMPAQWQGSAPMRLPPKTEAVCDAFEGGFAGGSDPDHEIASACARIPPTGVPMTQFVPGPPGPSWQDGRGSKRQRKPKEKEGVPGALAAAERAALVRAIEVLGRAFEEVCAAIAAGRLPAADDLEHARRQLVTALAATLVAAELGGFSRLVRTALLELVAALRSPGASIAVIAARLEAINRDLARVRKEADAVLGQAPKKGGHVGRFWEGMV